MNTSKSNCNTGLKDHLALVTGAGSGIGYASKHGVVGLTKAAAVEYSATGIRINAVWAHSIRLPKRWFD